ncbi:MAG: hypothetical protein ACQKBT_06740 [Puniceicoccales bacterium]
MSIINDALKKARREAGAQESPALPADENVIQPRKRVTAKQSIWMVLPVVFIFLLIFALLGGAGYYTYREFSQSAPADTPADEAVSETAAEPEETTAPTLVEPEPEDPEPAASGSTPEPSSPPAEILPAPTGLAAVLEQMKINGVMRGGSSVRVLTNSGVYRVGDPVAAPAGFIVEEIGETTLTLRDPDGELYTILLP